MKTNTSNETKHTPGPWTIKSGDSLAIQAEVEEFGMSKDVAILCEPILTDKREKSANARLLAAAPELLEACKAIFEEMGKRISPAAFDEFSEGAKTKLQSAIAKAEGRAV